MVEKHYKDDEIVVTVFGDHGQGYFVKNGEHFLSKGRTKIGFMVRGDYRSGEVCGELISTADYVNILGKLAGIEVNSDKIDGRLPQFFGGQQQRKYVLSESIHPKDPYYAAFFMKDKVCFFQSESTMDEHCTYADNKLFWG